MVIFYQLFNEESFPIPSVAIKTSDFLSRSPSPMKQQHGAETNSQIEGMQANVYYVVSNPIASCNYRID